MSSIRNLSRVLALIALVVSVLAPQPDISHAQTTQSCIGRFSNGVYDSRYTSYYYEVSGCPANTCGTLKLVRNGISETGSGWICTDSTGYARKGPWTATRDETSTNIRIEWPNGSRTYGGDYKVNDVTTPAITAWQQGGVGVPIPTAFSGTASDAQWGTGFSFGVYGWSKLYATFYNESTARYYNGQGYSSIPPVSIFGTPTPATPSFAIDWSVPPPPPSAHHRDHTYKWCVYINDVFYDAVRCIRLVGPHSNVP